MHINFHIRIHELIERDFPHFPICYLMHSFNPNIRSPLLYKHSQLFPKLTGQCNSDCSGTWRALTMPTPTRFALQFPQIKRYHLQRNNFTKPQKVRVWAENRCVSRPLHFMQGRGGGVACAAGGIFVACWQQIELETHFREQSDRNCFGTRGERDRKRERERAGIRWLSSGWSRVRFRS